MKSMHSGETCVCVCVCVCVCMIKKGKLSHVNTHTHFHTHTHLGPAGVPEGGVVMQCASDGLGLVVSVEGQATSTCVYDCACVCV
jgi:hypothetical protein